MLAARQFTQHPLESILVLPGPLRPRTRRRLRLRGRLGSGLRGHRDGRRIAVPGVAGRAHHDRVAALWAHDLESAPATSRATDGTLAPGALDLVQIFGFN
jgi:hypothetical protein